MIVLVCQMWDQHLLYEINNSQAFMALDYFFCINSQTQVIVGILVVVSTDGNISPDLASNGITVGIKGNRFDFYQVRISHPASAIRDIQYPAKVLASRLADDLQIGIRRNCSGQVLFEKTPGHRCYFQ